MLSSPLLEWYINKQTEKRLTIYQSIINELTMPSVVRATYKHHNSAISGAIKGTLIENIVENLKHNYMSSALAETPMKDAELQVELIRAPTTVITAARDQSLQVELIGNKIFEEAANLNNLGERWLRVTEGYRKQRDELRKDVEELRARAKVLEIAIERRNEKYEELVLCNLALTNFIHEQRIAASRVFELSRKSGVGDAKELKNQPTKKWRRCRHPGSKYRELAKNNNMARHFRRAHPNVTYGVSCYLRCD